MKKFIENTVYSNPVRYDDENWWKKDDLEMWKYLCGYDSNKNVLELASGTGRITFPLLKEGHNLTGIDLSKSFYDYACKLAKQYKYINCTFLNENMTNFNLHKKFDIIIIGFNSFLHLLNDDDARACLNCVEKHLHERGRFYIDIYRPTPLHYCRPNNLRTEAIEYFDTQINEKVIIEETNNYNVDEELNQITWYYSSKKKKDFQITKSFTRMYWPETMNRLILDTGLKILNIWGDYNFNHFNEKSNLQIYEIGK